MRRDPEAQRAGTAPDRISRPGPGTRLRVDMIACDGHGVCVELLPEWIALDDWGYPLLRDEAVPSHLLADAKWAVSNCPALALRLEPGLGRP